jgi:hypothetical protein
MSDNNDHLEQLAESLNVPALKPGQIHEALRLIVEELIKQRDRELDGGEF